MHCNINFAGQKDQLFKILMGTRKDPLKRCNGPYLKCLNKEFIRRFKIEERIDYF